MAMGNSISGGQQHIHGALWGNSWTQQTTNLLNGSDTSTTPVCYGRMDQQSYSNFFIISTVLGVPSNSQRKLKQIIPFHFWTFWLWSGVQNWPRKCAGSLLVVIIICTSSPTTHIT
jgi:hypothetical protein